jgi:hypothetical protein
MDDILGFVYRSNFPHPLSPSTGEICKNKKGDTFSDIT